MLFREHPVAKGQRGHVVARGPRLLQEGSLKEYAF